MFESHNQNPIRKISRYSHSLSPLTLTASKFYLQEKWSKLSTGNPSSSLDIPKGVCNVYVHEGEWPIAGAMLTIGTLIL